MLPNVDREAIKRAIAEFDAHIRHLPEWQDWEQRAGPKYLLEYEGNLYPPKKIVSIATGRPVSTFTGGSVTNKYLKELGFLPVQLVASHPPAALTQIPSFIIGHFYNRKEEITGRFGGSSQSGIAPSSQTQAIFIFTGGSGKQYGYTDEYDEFGFLLYTGEGQRGDMTMTRGNLAIASHAEHGRALHVFETTGKGKPCLYKGEFVYGSHFIRKGPDKGGNDRSVIVFRLMPVSNTLPVELGDTIDSGDLPDITDANGGIDLAKLRLAAIAACKLSGTIADPKEAVRLTYQRSAQVKRYVLARAQGCCELCEAPAPFNRKSDQSPYLEPHHINRLSDGGLDHPLYVGAICPTCHRRIHFGIDGELQNEELRVKVDAIEAEVSGAGSL